MTKEYTQSTLSKLLLTGFECRKSDDTGRPNFASFEQAQKYVRSTGEGFDLECVGAGIHVVTWRGSIVGKGMHWNSAIADAESNL